MSDKQLVTNFFKKYGENVNNAPGCCEPGYDDKPVIMANWNNIPARYFDALEHSGYACEWEDEWIVCDGCNKAFRTSPNCYDWEMYGDIFDGYATCGDCIDPTEYLEGLENKPRKALSCSLLRKIDPLEHGYKLVAGDYESGLHEGMNADPTKILSKLLESDKNGRYIFAITEQSQFYVTFAVYKRDNADESAA